MGDPAVYIALPVMAETQLLPALINSLLTQTYQDYRFFICVNQPDSWWQDTSRHSICLENQSIIQFLKSLNDSRITLIDRSTPGHGWVGKAHGIGWARKTIMDWISETAKPFDIILSLDADTTFGPAYLESIISNVTIHPEAVAFSIPYFHKLTGNIELDRAILRYEIYMRAYSINLWNIKSPYSFTALGSAIALPVWAYRAIGGITPKLSGEDFYFLQKLIKYGLVLHWNAEMVYPAARLSDRVFFGTGPALIKGIRGDWSSYPVYSKQLFNAVSDLYDSFPKLYEMNIPTPLDNFLESRSGGLPWDSIRKNSKSFEQFSRSCHEKIDGLRILQYLKDKNREVQYNDETATSELLKWIDQEQTIRLKEPLEPVISFLESPVMLLDSIRNAFFRSEMSFRKQHWIANTHK